MPVRIRSAGLTDIGRKRTINEDSFGIVEDEGLFLVADGMGGHNSGEIASKIAVETIVNFFKATSLDRDITWPYKLNKRLDEAENRVQCAIRLANSRIHETARRNKLYKGMGTTIVAVYVESDEARVAHVGDSRVYRLRGGELTQITEDHSLLNLTLKMRPMTPEEIERFPQKNVIMRALGVREDVEVEIQRVPVVPGDRLMLCSDGLSGLVGPAELAALLAERRDPADVCRRLVDAANERGGNDNISVVLLEAEAGGGVP